MNINNSELVASYVNGFHKVLIYTDRIEIGVWWQTPYRIDEIQSATIAKVLLVITELHLELWNGKKTRSVQLSATDAMACKSHIEKILGSAWGESSDTDNVFMRCTILGGSGTALVAGNIGIAIFGKDTVSLVSGTQRLKVQLNELTELKIEGPGRITSDAGVMGGGFGLEGALIGIGAATLLNVLTTDTTTNTVLYLAWPGAELFLHTSNYSPDEARLALSPAFTKIQSVKNVGGADIASQFERLAALMKSGAINAEEYALAKSKLLESGH
jgi:hypothetical protein